MSDSQKIILEKDKRFSESLFWHGQRQFYHTKGAEAWASEVPFYITSNPFIAECYAMLTLRFIQDWLRQYPGAKQHPFFIIELGSGTGQFSFYILKTLCELLDRFHLSSVKIVYVMTDFTQKNIDFWEKHQQLKPFVEQKKLDFALFNIESDTSIKTTKHHYDINSDTCKNPLLVFANYLFDSISNDIFKIKEHRIYESLVTLTTNKSNIKNESPKNWQKVNIHHNEVSTTSNYFNKKILNQVLQSYAAELEDSYLLFPTSCLQGLENLQKLCNNKLLLLSSDKGYSTIDELQELEYPELDFHGSFSLMVNYHAIAHYFKLNYGDSFIQSPRDGLVTAAFSSGFKLGDLTETHHLLNNTLEEFSPTDFFNFYELIESNTKNIALKDLVSALCFSRWDPFLFEQISERLADLSAKEDTQVIDYLINNLDKVADNFYYTPGCDDVFFSIGYLFYAIDHFDKAIAYFEKSQRYFPNNFAVLYNLALCYFYKKDYQKAITTTENALKVDPTSKDGKSLLRSCKLKKKATKRT